MKDALKTILVIAGITGLFVTYVHEQISLFKISFVLDQQYESLNRKAEEYRRLKFEVDQRKAPRVLEQKMKELELDLTLPKEIRVFRLAPKPEAVLASASAPPTFHPFSSSLMDFLGRWIEVAQAKTDS
ncbi:MAG: hypothetical protein HYZ85_00940 [Candidatus Omnitrophica bacterium]|nr:hypothetical protein [Candidatus Omnitrophota bacterium]